VIARLSGHVFDPLDTALQLPGAPFPGEGIHIGDTRIACERLFVAVDNGDLDHHDCIEEQRAVRVERHREAAFSYEARAIELLQSAFRVLMYLNGGALIAIPTVIALFQADPKQARFELVKAAACFVLGLLFIVGAQAASSLTMSRRSESEQAYEHLSYLIGEEDPDEDTKRKIRDYYDMGSRKIVRSNYLWKAGGVLFWLSIVAFVIGCWFGARAVLTS
jgi:hypothetical protein